MNRLEHSALVVLDMQNDAIAEGRAILSCVEIAAA